MSSITPHAGKWRAQVYVYGKRESKVFRTQRDAKLWASIRETELRKEEEQPVACKVTLHSLICKYIEEVSPKKRGEKKEVIRLRAIMRQIPDRPLSKVTSGVIKEYRDKRLNEVKPNSVLRELGALSSIFKFAIREWRMLDKNPVSEITKPARGEHRKVTISRCQIRSILKTMGYSPRGNIRTVAWSVACCFLVALRTGMRAGELCSLTWERVSEDSAHVWGKTPAANRFVPLTPKAFRLIEKMRGFDPDIVFGLKVNSLDAMFRKYRKRAGLEGFTFHDARHTAATWMVKYSKLNVLELCKIFGWTDPKMAMVYFQPTTKDLLEKM